MTSRWAGILQVGAVAMVALLTACGGSSAGSGSQGKVTITFLDWESTDTTEKPWIDALVTHFMDENPNITVKVEGIAVSDHLHQIITECSASSCPDIAETQENDIASLASAKVLQDVSGYDPSFIAKLPAGSVNLAKYQGTLYGITWSASPIGFWYNKALMQQVGLDPTKPPTSLADMESMIATAKAKNPNIIGLGIDTTLRDIAVDATWPFMHSYGAEPIKNGKADADTPEMRAYLSWIRDMVAKGYTLPGKKFGDFRTYAAQGRQLFMEDGPYFKGLVQGLNKNLTDQQFYDTWGVTGIPGGPANGPSAGPSDHQTVIFKSSKNKSAAFKFAEYLASDPYAIMQYTVKLGVLPPVSGLEQQVPALNNPASTEFIKLAGMQVVPPYGPNYENAVQIITSEVQRAYATKDSVDSISQDMQTKLKPLY
jgi:ABC-type glycerol-3-phosphate transport system substrate-binding protein